MLQKAKEWIEKSIKHLDFEFWKLQTGRANPSLVEDVLVDTYWSTGPIKNAASVNLLDFQTIIIKPWDKSTIWAIAKWITASWIWLNPQTMADSVMIKIPALTEERRREISKIAKGLAEEAKIWVRNVRWEIQRMIKKAEDDKEISEDIAKDLMTDLQKLVDDANKRIDEHYKHKDAEIMKI